MTKIIAFSDTHGLHRQIKIPASDLLLFAGDIGLESITKFFVLYDFVDFLNSCSAKHRVVIFGNHDRLAESQLSEVKKVFEEANIHLLHNTGIRLFDFNIWGSAYTPEFCNWSFSLRRGEYAKNFWSQIPQNTDILLTHGPPMNILDWTIFDGPDNHYGDQDLLDRVIEIKPKLHVFGHFHFLGGQKVNQKTIFINASSVDEEYQLRSNPFVEIEL